MTEDRPDWFEPPNDQQEIPDPDVASQSTTANHTWFEEIEPSPTPPGGDQGWSDGIPGETGTDEEASAPADRTEEVELSEPEAGSEVDAAQDGHSKPETPEVDSTAHHSDQPAEVESSDSPAAGEEPSPSPATAGESEQAAPADTGPDEATETEEAALTQDDELTEAIEESSSDGPEYPSVAETPEEEESTLDEEFPEEEASTLDEEIPEEEASTLDEEVPEEEEHPEESESDHVDTEALAGDDAGLSVGEDSPYEPADREGLIKGTTEPTEKTPLGEEDDSVPSEEASSGLEVGSSGAGGEDIPNDVSEKMDGWPNTEEEDSKRSESGSVPDPEPVAVSEPESDDSEDAGRSYRKVINKIKSVFSRK